MLEKKSSVPDTAAEVGSARSSASDVASYIKHQPRSFSRSSSKAGTAHVIGQLGDSLGSRPGSSAEYINSIDYFREPVVKSPAEPTRVRSPEAVVSACYSPDPINWTVPLDTGKTFSVTQSVKEGAGIHPQFKSSRHPRPFFNSYLQNRATIE